MDSSRKDPKFTKEEEKLLFDSKSSACFCDNSYGSYGTASNCNSACQGKSSEICGGGWANSVYSTSCCKFSIKMNTIA